MLSSWTFWYSGVSGACCARPHALVGSYLMAWPPRRGLMTSHWPLQLGYFASSAALTADVVVSAIASAAANATAPVMRRSNMISLLRFAFLLRDRDERDVCPRRDRIHRLHAVWNGSPARDSLALLLLSARTRLAESP